MRQVRLSSLRVTVSYHHHACLLLQDKAEAALAELEAVRDDATRSVKRSEAARDQAEAALAAATAAAAEASARAQARAGRRMPFRAFGVVIWS